MNLYEQATRDDARSSVNDVQNLEVGIASTLGGSDAAAEYKRSLTALADGYTSDKPSGAPSNAIEL